MNLATINKTKKIRQKYTTIDKRIPKTTMKKIKKWAKEIGDEMNNYKKSETK